MKKIISFCLYGNKDLYCLGLIENIDIINKKFKDWVIYVYYANISEKIFDKASRLSTAIPTCSIPSILNGLSLMYKSLSIKIIFKCFSYFYIYKIPNG